MKNHMFCETGRFITTMNFILSLVESSAKQCKKNSRRK